MTAADIDDLPSRPFKGFDWSEHYNVQKLIVALFGEYEAWYRGTGEDKRIKYPEKVKLHLTHFALEAYRTHRALPGMSMGVHLGNDYYQEKNHDRYHPRHLSYRIVINVTEFLVAAGYLELPFGKAPWDPDPDKRRLTRFQPTQQLIRVCHEYQINLYMITRYGGPEIIIMHAKRKRRKGKKLPPESIEYQDTQFTKQARKNLKNINEFIAGHNINLDITDYQEQALRRRMLSRIDHARDSYLDFNNTRLRRIFNNDCFEQGGRFYGG